MGIRELIRAALGCLLIPLGAAQAAAFEGDGLEPIRDQRRQGNLDRAKAVVEERLAVDTLEVAEEVALRLELARILDRVGLHTNTRPVAAALDQVDSAALALREPSPGLEAAVELARAELQYRTGPVGFPAAALHANRAARNYQRVGDAHGWAEAVHLLGLISLQSGDLLLARIRFERSIALDRAADERPLFRGEYERHIGMVEMMEGDTAAAIPHFEHSLALRREAGAVDASLFAAITLASTLMDVGRFETATPHVLYATTVASRLDSPLGRAQATLLIGRLQVHAGDHEAARLSFTSALRIGESITASGIVQQATSRIRDLRGATAARPMAPG